MSNRALRRLHQSRQAESNSDPGQLPPGKGRQQATDGSTDVTQSCVSGEENSDDSDGDAQVHVQQANRFDLLVEGDHDEPNAEDNSDEENSHEAQRAESAPAKTKRKNKRKKKKKQLPTEAQLEEDDEDIDQILSDIQEFGGDYRVYQQQMMAREARDLIPGSTRDILSVEHKNLNAQNELMRIFGSRVVRADNENRRIRKNRTLRLAQHKDTWPPLTKSGLTMSVKETQGHLHHFTFEHNQHYQKAQQLFLDAVESMNPHNVMDVLRAHPYHIDTLLQISDITRMSEDMPMAADLIERALYAQEAAFHPMFSLTNGNSRLDYRYPENRSFMISLFRHITFVGLKGCYRTSLEFCKLLLSLSPDDDPLGVLLMLDFYALLSHEYAFLTNLFHEWEDIASLSVRNYDPLPPSDSISTYTRAPRRTRLQEDNRIFATFIRSLLPNFNADEAPEEGAAGGGEPPSLQQGISALMAAMRDLLHNIQPVPPPVENEHDEHHPDEEWD